MADSVKDLVQKLYGGDYESYRGQYNQAYQNLNQPYNDVNPTSRNAVISHGTTTLASTFIDRVLKKTGNLPTEDQVRQFVFENLTPGFAQKDILGEVNLDQINSMAEEHLASNPEIVSSLTTKTEVSAPESRILGLGEQLNKIYEAGKKNFLDRYDTEVYTPAKTSVVNDLAGQGLLTQPTSRYSLDSLEASRSRDIQRGLNTLEGEKAAGSVDLGKTIENLLADERRAGESAGQFNKSLGLQKKIFSAGRDDADYTRGLERRKLDLADRLGRLQAEANEPGTLDYINTSFKGLSSLGQLIGAIKGGKNG